MTSPLEQIRDFGSAEKNVIGTLNTMASIEMNDGASDARLASLGGLLGDFLEEETRNIDRLINEQPFFQDYILRRSMTTSAINEIATLFGSEYALFGYRMVRLKTGDELDREIDLINSDIYLELIERTQNITLKYQLCFLNPYFMDLLAKSNFDHRRVNLDPLKSSAYPIRKLSFLISACSSFIIFMLERGKIEDPICLSYLDVIKDNISIENFRYVCDTLIKIGYDEKKINQIFTRLDRKII